MIDLRLGDCVPLMAGLEESSVDLIVADFPYYKVKGDYWDRQWDTAQGFLDWMDTVLEQFARVLRANGSLYAFASPEMTSRVSELIRTRFNVLNEIRWVKEAGWHNKTEKEALRSYLSPYESVIFAERKNSDFDYRHSDGVLHFEIMKPVRDYLNQERERAGITVKQIDKATGTSMASHWFTHPSQWTLLTQEWYEKLRVVFSNLNHGGMYLQRDYSELRQQYEELRQQYEERRRPFSVSADVPYTDVWTFKTVSHYAGKHPCEKPQDMLEHIVKASSRDGAVVLDPFMGTGNSGIVAHRLGRSFIGMDNDARYFAQAEERIRQQQMVMAL